MKKASATVDEYISEFSEDIRERLKLTRRIIKENAPEAVESISYGMPAYKLNKKPLVYFGGYQSHIGFYATPSGHTKFKKELSSYKQGKGSVQFPFDKPLPIDLIAEMVKFRVAENMGI
ncbi:iron chaperone [Maribacter arenosus]|uniref:DUF1801 domain-containing protein n=1 Tax=Maribacter arenosus TaxID=1854708 RepID=A0ABR7VDX2_9FLAO|nr:DUF1801 domain-containing protein [Maribacter arenosus]MBD0851839.1 DUF1801 domain-containing protein [Maribacter arenosus]